MRQNAVETAGEHSSRSLPNSSLGVVSSQSPPRNGIKRMTLWESALYGIVGALGTAALITTGRWLVRRRIRRRGAVSVSLVLALLLGTATAAYAYSWSWSGHTWTPPNGNGALACPFLSTSLSTNANPRMDTYGSADAAQFNGPPCSYTTYVAPAWYIAIS